MAARIETPDGDCLAYEKITATTSSIGFTAAKITNKGQLAKAVLITCETAAVRFTMDGTTPVITATSGGTGHLLDVGQSFIVRGTKSIYNFRCINAVASSGGLIICSFYFQP
jgi:hypothetical protein